MRASENTSWMTARSWLVSDALPLWAETGFDQNRNAFHERLTLDGIPIHDVPRRLMVQSRQIYSYATVAQHNWIEGANDLVAIAARSMVRDYYEADSRPGWVMSVDSHRCVVEAREISMVTRLYSLALPRHSKPQVMIDTSPLLTIP
jgi:mannose-6-phosphate isomerase